MNFSLGNFFAAAENGREHELRASRNFTAQDVRQIAAQACEAFRTNYMNLLSCFRLEGDLELWATLNNYIQTKNAATEEINGAVQGGDEGGLFRAFVLAMKLAFIALQEKGALRRLQLIDPLPPEALQDLQRLRGITQPTRADQARAAAQAAAAHRQEYIDFSNDPTTSMEKIQDRRRKDPGYEQFYQEQYLLRVQEEGASDRRPRL